MNCSGLHDRTEGSPEEQGQPPWGRRQGQRVESDPRWVGLCLCSLLPRGHSLHCSLKDSLNSVLSHGSQETNSSVSPLFSDSQILVLIKPYKAPHDLLPLQIIIFMIGNLFKEASMPHPLLLFSPHLLLSSNTCMHTHTHTQILIYTGGTDCELPKACVRVILFNT